jgi:hypothetical protein
MNKRKMWTGIVVGGLAALILTVGATTAFAQATETDTQGRGQAIMQGVAGRLGERFGGRGERGGWMGDDDGFGRGGMRLGGELLANALGITEDELQTAMETAHAQAIQQAVDAGLITQAQADQMQGGGRMRGLHLGDAADEDAIDMDALLAEALGITPAELQEAKDNALDLGVEAGLITQEQANQATAMQQIGEAVRQAADQAIQEAVDAGLLTQEQADAMLSHGPGGFGWPGGPGEFGEPGEFGGRGHGHGHGMHPFGQPDSSDDQQ